MDRDGRVSSGKGSLGIRKRYSPSSLNRYCSDNPQSIPHFLFDFNTNALGGVRSASLPEIAAPDLIRSAPVYHCSHLSMSDPTQTVEQSSNQAIYQAGGESTAPSASGQHNASFAEYPPLEPYALQFAPMMWLHEKEQYWPGDPLEHLENCIPQNKDGKPVPVPEEVMGRCDSLKLPGVNHPDVFLCLNVSIRISRYNDAHYPTEGRPSGERPNREARIYQGQAGPQHAPLDIRLLDNPS